MVAAQRIDESLNQVEGFQSYNQHGKMKLRLSRGVSIRKIPCLIFPSQIRVGFHYCLSLPSSNLNLVLGRLINRTYNGSALNSR